MIRGWLSRVFPRRVVEVKKYASWLPLRAGAVLGIENFQGVLLIACEHGVWRLRGTLQYDDLIVEQIL